MKDLAKFKALAAAGALLCVLAVGYAVASEYFLPDVEDYIKRRIYYETVISKKGLSLHRAEHWRKVEGRQAEGPEESGGGQ